jgi:membrane protein implicated in regulation of membrane protease activity
MPWWAWIVIGSLLLAAELALIDAQFYLVFIGAAALLVGGAELAGIPMPEPLQWLVFAGLSVALLLVFRQRIYDLTKASPGNVVSGPAGEEVSIPVDLAPGASCRVDFRGSTWTAQNKSEVVLPAGSQARIVNVDGLTLQIVPSK